MLDNINQSFDELYHQIEKGVTIEQYIKGIRCFEFEKFKEWKSRYGYIFDVFSNEHLINNERHFHFKHLEKNINCKISFSGEILESKGENDLDSKTIKTLIFFLSQENVNEKLNKMWEDKNPQLG